MISSSLLIVNMPGCEYCQGPAETTSACHVSINVRVYCFSSFFLLLMRSVSHCAVFHETVKSYPKSPVCQSIFAQLHAVCCGHAQLGKSITEKALPLHVWDFVFNIFMMLPSLPARCISVHKRCIQAREIACKNALLCFSQVHSNTGSTEELNSP